MLLPLAALSLCACNTITTKVPGVVDLRSDASGAPTDSASKVEGARSGFDSIMSGDGTTATSGNVKINEKRYWVIGLIPVGDADVAPEIAQASAKGALRNVHIGEEYTLFDGVERICVSAIPVVDILDLVLPAWDVNIDGTKVKTGDATEPPSPAAAPATPVTPPPPAPGT